MSKVKKIKKIIEEQTKVDDLQVAKVQNELIETLNKDEQYSLIVDPQNKYNFSDEQKKFIENYVQFKNVSLAADLTGIEKDRALQYFVAYNSQQEIRRINRALYHRQFASKLVSLDEIGGYLTSLLTDENVPVGDQLSSKQKLKVVEMIVELHKLKQGVLSNPNSVSNNDLSDALKNLSVKTIMIVNVFL